MLSRTGSRSTIIGNWILPVYASQVARSWTLGMNWYPNREAVLLLGDGKGNFGRAATKGLKVEPQANYDLTVADVNGDGRPDVIILYESQNESRLGLQDGSIHVFLNRGVEGQAAPASAVKKK